MQWLQDPNQSNVDNLNSLKFASPCIIIQFQ